MSTQYNSEKIRILAQRIGRTADAMSDVGNRTLKGVLQEIPDNFRGSAATALENSVDDLISDVRAVTGNLTEIRDALNALARRVEIADQQAKAIIDKN